MTPFYGWRSIVSLFFTTKSPGVHGTYMIDQGRIKGKIIMDSL